MPTDSLVDVIIPVKFINVRKSMAEAFFREFKKFWDMVDSQEIFIESFLYDTDTGREYWDEFEVLESQIIEAPLPLEIQRRLEAAEHIKLSLLPIELPKESMEAVNSTVSQTSDNKSSIDTSKACCIYCLSKNINIISHGMRAGKDYANIKCDDCHVVFWISDPADFDIIDGDIVQYVSECGTRGARKKDILDKFKKTDSRAKIILSRLLDTGRLMKKYFTHKNFLYYTPEHYKILFGDLASEATKPLEADKKEGFKVLPELEDALQDVQKLFKKSSEETVTVAQISTPTTKTSEELSPLLLLKPKPVVIIDPAVEKKMLQLISRHPEGINALKLAGPMEMKDSEVLDTLQKLFNIGKIRIIKQSFETYHTRYVIA